MCPNSQKLSKSLEDRTCRGWDDAIHITLFWREVRLLKTLFPNLLATKEKLPVVTSHVNSL